MKEHAEGCAAHYVGWACDKACEGVPAKAGRRRLNIKPMSVNDVWQGKRYKTKSYKQYERDVLLLLRPMQIPDGPLQIYLKWGFSSAASDYDNPIKPFQDCLQKKYGFDDKRIERAIVEKVKVSKGAEFIEYEITALENS